MYFFLLNINKKYYFSIKKYYNTWKYINNTSILKKLTWKTNRSEVRLPALY
jgi:hypothetical protein